MNLDIKHKFKAHLKQNAMIIALVSIVILFQIITNGILLKPLNVSNLFLQNSYILVLAIGMLLCILTGGNIDLSVGSVAAFVGAISATLSVTFGVPTVPTIIISLIVGALVGIWQGYWIAYVRIPSFIATLAGMLVFRGLTMVILKGRTLSPYPEAYQKIASGFIPDFFNGENIHITTVLVGVICSIIYIYSMFKKRQSKKKFKFEVPSIYSFLITTTAMVVVLNLFTVWLALYKGIPNVLILLASLVVIYTFITTKTVVGRHIYALGGNEKAAMLSGVKTKRVLFGVYVNMAIMAALAGIIFSGRLNAATPKAGNLFELDAIAACYIGGASATGGIGTIIGAMIGGLIMGVLNNGMSILGVSIDWQQAIKGMVLLFAVAFDVYSKKRTK